MNNRLLALFLFLILAVSVGHAVLGEAPPSTVTVNVPEYNVEVIGGWDYADIPGGYVLLVVGKPRVPFYSASIEYPSGYRIQGVTMRERSGLVTAMDLNLSTVTQVPASSPGVAPSSSENGDWYPERDFSWQVFLNLDGSSTLIIDTFPFYYNSGTKEVRFYRHYEFEIAYILSVVSITDLATDKAVYDPGEEVKVNVMLRNAGEAKDVVAGALIRLYGSDEVVGGLPLRTLHAITGDASFSMTWSSEGFSAGDYCVEVTLNDTSGNWLDRRVSGFRLGRIMINVTGFNVGPKHFTIGDPIKVELEARNAGSCTISGRCVFIVLEGGEEVQRFHLNFSSLAPGGSLKFTSTWNTSSAEKGAIYRVIGYVSYESRTTDPMVAVVSTNLFPIAEFNFSPTKVGLGEVVTFDASGSNDPDGTLVSYEWKFGDGGGALGETVTHAYHALGDYEVFLTIRDDEGASNKTRQVLEVVMMYALNVSSNIEVAMEGSGTYREGDEVTLSAPSSVSMPGILGLLGAKYVFKQWIGALNSTESTVTLVFSGYRPTLEMRAIYVEDYTGAIVVASVAVVATAAIAAISLRKRRRGGPHKPPEVPPPPPSTGEKVRS